MADTEPFAARLRRLRDDRGLSRSQLSRATAAVDGVGVPEITIKVLETKPERQPERRTIEVLSNALGVPPEDFPEYRLEVARRELDQREVGLDQALRMLEQIEKALRVRAAAPRREAEREPGDARQPPASRRGSRNRRAS